MNRQISYCVDYIAFYKSGGSYHASLTADSYKLLAGAAREARDSWKRKTDIDRVVFGEVQMIIKDNFGHSLKYCNWKAK